LTAAQRRIDGERLCWKRDRRGPIVAVSGGCRVMQISRPRDLGPLMFVIGLFVILFGVTLVIGGPQR
jgi:hypothetical protein